MASECGNPIPFRQSRNVRCGISPIAQAATGKSRNKKVPCQTLKMRIATSTLPYFPEPIFWMWSIQTDRETRIRRSSFATWCALSLNPWSTSSINRELAEDHSFQHMKQGETSLTALYSVGERMSALTYTQPFV